MAGFDPFSVNYRQATVPKVRDEIKSNSIAMVRFNTAVDNAKVKVKEPSKDFWNKVRASAKKLGDSFFLSETDLQILALALELKEEGCIPTILTDDYSIQKKPVKLPREWPSVFIPPNLDLKFARYFDPRKKTLLQKLRIFGGKVKRIIFPKFRRND